MKYLGDKFTSVGNKISSKIKSAKKTISKYAITAATAATMLGGLTYSNTIHAQDTDYQKQWAIMDPYSQPNVVQGDTKGKLEYYGSGDVNLDGKVDLADAQQIYLGVSNDMADVNGDGQVTAADGQMIEDDVNGKISYLPSHWDELSQNEKKDWAKK